MTLFPTRPAPECRCSFHPGLGLASPLQCFDLSCLGSPSLGYALAHQVHLVFLWFFGFFWVGGCGERSRLEGGRVLL